MKSIFQPIILLSFLFISLALHGQKIIVGTVQDEMSQSLPFAAVAILQDSIPVMAVQTEMDGIFLLSPKQEKTYILKITYVGYENFEKSISISSLKDTLNIGVIQLKPLSKMLGEAVITAQREPVQIKGDTVEFAASAFKTQPNAPAEELIKKMPGVEIDRNGAITAKGETVKKILVNGKPYFGNDPKIALQNFPAEAIESVQVFEKKSDQAEFSGIDNGEREMTINIIIKPSYNNRISARLMGGLGTDDRYIGRGNYNRFSETQKLTVLGAANNINRTGFSEEDFLAFANNGRPANGQNNNVSKGFQETQTGGLNFIQNRSSKTDVNLSYFYNNQNFLNDRVVARQNFLPTGNYNSKTKAITTTGNRNHRINGYIDQKLDSLTSFRLTLNGSYTENTNISNSFSENFRRETVKQTQTQRSTNTEGSGLAFNSNILFRHRFKKAGRTISLNGSYNKNTGDRLAFTDAKTQYYDTITQLIRRIDTIFQNDRRGNVRDNYAGNLSYTESFSKKFLGELNYRYSTVGNNAEREVFNFLRNEYNQALSSFYNNAFVSHRVGATLRFNPKSWNMSAGIQGQRSLLRGDFITTQQVVRQKFEYILPNFRTEWQMTKEKRLGFFYETDVREPSIEQLQPVQDNTDPLNLYLGNPDLKPEYMNRLRATYTDYNKKTNAYLNANLNVTFTDNKIVSALTVDTLLRRTFQPINVNGFLDASGHVSYGLRFWKQRIRANFSTNVSQSQGVSLINGENNLTKRFNASLNSRLELRFQDTFEIAIKGVVRYSDSRFSLQQTLNQTFWIYEYEGEMTVGLPWDMRLNTIFNYNLYTATAFANSQGIPILNIALSKYFNQRKSEIRLSIIDALNRNTGINRSADANYIQEEIVRSLGRYALLTYTYNLNKKRGKGSSTKEDN